MESMKKWLSERNTKRNGMYVHYSPPKLLGVVSGAQLRQWARGGTTSRLERAVLAGQGHRLLSEAEALPLSHHLTNLVTKCDALHAAVEKGSLLELQELLETDYNRRKFVTCLDEAGAGLLHKAVYYDFTDISRYLVQNYPQLVHQRDSEGRTPLHYAAASRDEAGAAALLEAAGAARGARDAAGHTPAYYRAHRSAELTLPAREMAPEPSRNPPGLVIKRSNIRIWCHDCDMARLQRVVWDGHGTRLLSEVSNQPVVKKFLEAVPYIMNTIREIHNTVVQNDLEGLMKLTSDPVPPQILSSRDAHNMTVMHKAAGLGHGGILKYITDRYPQGINDVDNDGRTPLHYAAAVKDEQHTYTTLVSCGADEGIVDNKNRTPGYYINRPQEIDKNIFKTLPDAPRTPSSAYPSSWDWKLLDTEVIAELNKKSRRKNHKASNENTSKNNTYNTISESTDNRIGGMKASNTHEFIKDLPELDKDNHGIIEINKDTDENEDEHEDENEHEVENEDENEHDVENEDENDHGIEDRNENMEEEENHDKPEHVEDVEQAHLKNEEDLNPENDIREAKHDEETDNLSHIAQVDVNKIDNSTTPENDEIREREEHNDQEVNDKNETINEVIENTNENPEDVSDEDKNVNDIILNQENNGNEDLSEEPDDTEENKSAHDRDDKYNDNVDDAFKGHEKGEPESNIETNNVPESDQKKEDLEVASEEIKNNEGDSGVAVSEGNVNGRNTQESLIEGIVSGDAEQDTQDASVNDKEAEIQGDILIVDSEIDPEVTDLINSANMEMLATLVLNGEGARLIGRRSDNLELQAFLDNVSSYMQKINKVHVAAKEGNLKNLQAALDRRKFAIARDPTSPNGATPLHVATIFGKTNIMKYLGGRFPETLSAVDFEGRTALHYAAVLPDNGHYYNLLQQLGANAKDLDDSGRSADDFFKDQSLLPYTHLFEEFGVSDETAQNMLSDKGTSQAANGHMDIPIFRTDEGRYLAKSLGDPLIKGLTEVANVKPKDPVAFLASFLHNFPEQEKPRLGTQESNVLVTREAAEVENDQPPVRSAARTAVRPHRPIDVITVDPQGEASPDGPEAAFSSVNRDEHGQSMLHFAAARSHSRNALFEMLQESDINLGYRDELYRTARDVSIQANVPENTTDIDKFVLHLAARGNKEKIMELLLEGYDHILDVIDEDGVPITEVVAQRGDADMSGLLASIPAFEESRELLHGAVRRGDLPAIKQALTAEGGRTLARCQNSFGRTALHIAVLAQHEDVVEYLAENFPELLRIGDNLERTPLHYAMGVEKIESLSRLLIRAGAKRVLKDLKGRQPSYYFMNKSDILRLKEEEEVI